MISFAEAMDLLMGEVVSASTERVRIENAAGRILREEVVTDREYPPFDRVMMDGYALRSADWENGARRYVVTGQAVAGAAEISLRGEGNCVEVMTGAPCPAGADCVVPVEEVLRVESGLVVLRQEAEPVPGRYIHR